MQSSRTRPRPVTLVALVHFAGAGILICFILLTILDPGANLASHRFVETLVYILTRRNIAQSPLIPIFMPLSVVYLSVAGWGLWNLQKWARHLVVGASGLTVILWLRALLVRDWAMGDNILPSPWARQTVYATILFNAIICGSLVLYPEVAQAFDEED
jgi:hypothetical protein